jgi:hypothetical protein
MNALEDALHGAWGLVRWEIAYSDGRAPSYPYGKDAEGLLLYTPDGHMSAGVSRSARAPLSSASTRHAPMDEKCAAFDSYFHYQGRYRIEGDCVVHDVSHALNPNFPGTQQVRKAELHGGELELSATDELPGSTVTRHHRLRWRRLAHPS